jgi:transcriptional regulator with XRE-family HTH domain
MAFKSRLKELREQAGLTQAELAKRSGLHSMAISKLGQGQRKPAWATVLALAKALGMECTAFQDVPSAKKGKKAAGENSA